MCACVRGCVSRGASFCMPALHTHIARSREHTHTHTHTQTGCVPRKHTHTHTTTHKLNVRTHAVCLRPDTHTHTHTYIHTSWMCVTQTHTHTHTHTRSLTHSHSHSHAPIQNPYKTSNQYRENRPERGSERRVSSPTHITTLFLAHPLPLPPPSHFSPRSLSLSVALHHTSPPHPTTTLFLAHPLSLSVPLPLTSRTSPLPTPAPLDPTPPSCRVCVCESRTSLKTAHSKRRNTRNEGHNRPKHYPREAKNRLREDVCE